MKKYEIYLPLKYNNGEPIEPEKIKQVREELIAMFGAITASALSGAISRNVEIRRRGIH